MKRGISLLLMILLTGSMIIAQQTGISKDETVFAVLDPTGAVKNVIVSDWIHSDKPGIEVRDRSNLSNIENVKGYEQPRKSGDSIYWKLDGSDLYYRGKSSKALPLQVTIKYWLDGKLIDPNLLSGKTGTVRVRVEVRNLAASDRMIDGVKRRIYAPMIVAVGLTLPVIGYRDLSVAGGSIFTDGQTNVVAGLLLPGLKDSILAAGSFGSTIDLSAIGLKSLPFPEAFEFSVVAESFKLGPIFIAATPDFPDLGGANTVKVFDDALVSFQQLVDAAKAISDGSQALATGAKSLSDNIALAASSISQLIKDNGDILLSLSSYLSNEESIQGARDLLKNVDGLISLAPDLNGILDKLLDPKTLSALSRIVKVSKDLDLKDLLNIPGVSSLISEDSIASMAEALVASDDLYRGMDERRLMAAANFAAGAGSLFTAITAFDETAKAYDPAQGTVLQEFGASAANYAAAEAKIAKLGNFDASKAGASIGERAKADAAFVASTSFLDSPQTADLIAKLNSGSELSESERSILARLLSASQAERNAAKSAIEVENQAAAALPVLGESAGLLSAAKPAAIAAANFGNKIIPGLQVAKDNRTKAEQSVAAGRVIFDPKTVSTITTIVPKIFTARRSFEKNKAIYQAARSYLAVRMKDGGFRGQITALDSLQKDVKSLEPILLDVQVLLESPRIASFLQKGESSATVANARGVLANLKALQPVIDLAQNVLKPENIDKLRDILAKLPEMTSGFAQLTDGSALLSEKMGELAAGTKQFNELGIQKLSADVVDKAKLLRGFLRVKDELTALSKDYQTFSGAPDGADTSLKFIFKTDEIR